MNHLSPKITHAFRAPSLGSERVQYSSSAQPTNSSRYFMGSRSMKNSANFGGSGIMLPGLRAGEGLVPAQLLLGGVTFGSITVWQDFDLDLLLALKNRLQIGDGRSWKCDPPDRSIVRVVSMAPPWRWPQCEHLWMIHPYHVWFTISI